jgi:hypothetical protein
MEAYCALVITPELRRDLSVDFMRILRLLLLSFMSLSFLSFRHTSDMWQFDYYLMQRFPMALR